MVTDQEPRYRLVDSNGNIVGTLFAESDGTLKLQEGTSGNENELSLLTDGILSVESFGTNISDATDVSGNRSAGSNFTNNTDRVKIANILLENETGSTGDINASLQRGQDSSGLAVADATTRSGVPDGDKEVLRCLVPPGGVYRLNLFGDSTITQWLESEM